MYRISRYVESADFTCSTVLILGRCGEGHCCTVLTSEKHGDIEGGVNRATAVPLHRSHVLTSEKAWERPLLYRCHL